MAPIIRCVSEGIPRIRFGLVRSRLRNLVHRANALQSMQRKQCHPCLLIHFRIHQESRSAVSLQSKIATPCVA